MASSSVAKKGLQQYLLQLQKHPLRTKAITAGVLSAISDIVAQKLSGIQKLQLKRLLLKVAFHFKGMTDSTMPSLASMNHNEEIVADLPLLFLKNLFGFAYLGPFGHFLHMLLDKIFKGRKDTKTVAQKVVLEQLTSSPWNNLMFMIYFGLVVEERPWAHVKTKIKKDYPSVQLTAWTFWPVIGWVNHQYMPLQFRVIFHSVVACFWGIFLNLRARTMALPKS